MSVSARLKLSAVTGTALLLALAEQAAPGERGKADGGKQHAFQFFEMEPDRRLSILRTSGPPTLIHYPAFIVPMIHFRLQSLLNYSFGNDNGRSPSFGIAITGVIAWGCFLFGPDAPIQPVRSPTNACGHFRATGHGALRFERQT